MGTRAFPIVAFGFNLGFEEDIEVEGFAVLAEATGDMEDGDWPVQLVNHGHHEYPAWFVAIRGTVVMDNDWGGVVDVHSYETSDQALSEAGEWCDKHKIPWQEPRWRAMAGYR